MIKMHSEGKRMIRERPWAEFQFNRFVKVLNRCEGQSLATVAPHNGPSFKKGMSNDKIARKGMGCKDPS